MPFDPLGPWVGLQHAFGKERHAQPTPSQFQAVPGPTSSAGVSAETLTRAVA